MNRKKIFVLDDDLHMREGLEAYLSSDFDVYCFDAAARFLGALKNGLRPDCILLDLRMPQVDGFQVLSALRDSGSTSPVIFMSGDADKVDVIEAWREGASDFVLKPFSADALLSSIQNVLGRSPAHPETRGSGEKDYTKLSITKREAQVLRLLGLGLRQQEIAQRLGLSLRTVKMYRSFLKDKLHLNTPIEVAQFFERHKEAIEERALKKGPRQSASDTSIVSPQPVQEVARQPLAHVRNENQKIRKEAIQFPKNLSELNDVIRN